MKEKNNQKIQERKLCYTVKQCLSLMRKKRTFKHTEKKNIQNKTS